MIKQLAATTETGQSQQSQPWINKSGTRSKSGFLPPCFNSIFLLTRHSSVFQIIPLNWKHLTNRKVQGKKVFWHVSNNVNEVIRAVLNFFFFLTKRFHTHILTKSKMWGLQTKSSHPTFRQYVCTNN